MTEARKRYTRADWLEAAKKIFIDTGVEDVKVDVIAKRMKITRGSFYWHFKGREDLLNALLEDWTARNIAGIDALRAKRGGSPTLADCIRFWVAMEEDVLTFDMAMRVWGRKSEKVAAATKRIDEAWMKLLTEVFKRRGNRPEMARARARVMYFHQIGYYTLDLREDLESRIRNFPLYHEILTGDAIDPDVDELIAELKARRAA
ncbi:MAG: TetR/AcrR family transcriptional regulator [Oceanicaulis sp.]